MGLLSGTDLLLATEVKNTSSGMIRTSYATCTFLVPTMKRKRQCNVRIAACYIRHMSVITVARKRLNKNFG